MDKIIFFNIFLNILRKITTWGVHVSSIWNAVGHIVESYYVSTFVILFWSLDLVVEFFRSIWSLPTLEGKSYVPVWILLLVHNLFETSVLLLLQIPCCLQNPPACDDQNCRSKFSFAIAVVLCCIAWQPLVLCCALLSFICWGFHSYHPISSEGINQCRGELSTQAQAISRHLYKCINKKKGLGCFTHLFVCTKQALVYKRKKSSKNSP